MRNYNQLTQTEHYQIYALRKANKNPLEISRVLGRHKSAIYRELKRNLGKRGYRAVQAHQFAVERHMSRDRRRISLEDLVVDRIFDSPRLESGTNQPMAEEI